MAQSSGRFYFYTKQGREMRNHPLNGAVADGAGCFVNNRGNETLADNGKYPPIKVQGKMARMRLTIAEGNKIREITAADFGNETVLVKLWHKGQDYYSDSEWFFLVPENNRLNGKGGQ